jgi:hypothetical protein
MPNLKEIFAKLKLNTLMPDLKYNKNSPKEVTLNNTKIDYKVINTLLVQNYTKTILITIKNDLSEKYLKLREQEKQLEIGLSLTGDPLLSLGKIVLMSHNGHWSAMLFYEQKTKGLYDVRHYKRLFNKNEISIYQIKPFLSGWLKMLDLLTFSEYTHKRFLYFSYFLLILQFFI